MYWLYNTDCVVMYLQITLPNFLLYIKTHFYMLLANIFDYDIKSTFS